MDILVVGDIHVCYCSFRQMLNKHWNPEKEMLVQVGDLVDRGRNTPQVVGLARKLSEEFPGRAVFLKGNHDFEMTEHFRNPPDYNWLRQGGAGTIDQYAESDRDILEDTEWLSHLPLFWENEFLFISHAGIANRVKKPYEEDLESMLWTRSSLKNLGKLQFVGHTPQKEPMYAEKSHAWYIDTGAVFCNCLSGAKVSREGTVKEWVRIKTEEADL